MDFAGIPELLEDHDQNKGALLCEPDTFRFLCKLERRRVERESRLPLIYLGLLTFTSAVFQLSSLKIREAMEELQQVLLKNLRKSDVISRWSETQFVLFFPGLNLEQAERAMQRISTIFKETCWTEGVDLQGSIHPLSPWGR